MERHYGMDWLRIGAFALLILYHVGMVFVPWGFEVKTAAPIAWAEIPMFLTNPWRLSLLFLVSGYASRAMIARGQGAGAFAGSRTRRLLIPLLAGMCVFVAPQPWVKLVTQQGYANGLGWFYLQDYFRFGSLSGELLPTWMHLWFVAYLWVYSMLLALGLALIRLDLQPLFDRMFGGARALVLPLLWIVLVQSVLFHRAEDTHDLVADWPAHARYVPVFLFGFGLAGSPAVLGALAKWWKLSAGLAIAAWVMIAALLILWSDFSFPSMTIGWVFRIARDIETWLAIAALVGIAHRFWNRDHRLRPMLTEAVFPFYIIHQTAIVVLMFWLLPLALSAGAEFAILVAGTWAACWGFYLIGRKVGWLRPLIGLRRVARREPSARETVLALGV